MWERPKIPKRPTQGEPSIVGYQPVEINKEKKSRWLSLKEVWRDFLIWWNWWRKK